MDSERSALGGFNDDARRLGAGGATPAMVDFGAEPLRPGARRWGGWTGAAVSGAAAFWRTGGAGGEPPAPGDDGGAGGAADARGWLGGAGGLDTGGFGGAGGTERGGLGVLELLGGRGGADLAGREGFEAGLDSIFGAWLTLGGRGGFDAEGRGGGAAGLERLGGAGGLSLADACGDESDFGVVFGGAAMRPQWYQEIPPGRESSRAFWGPSAQ